MIPRSGDANKRENEGLPDLAPDHMADLRRSGLTDETIRAAGLYTERDPRRVADLLGWDRPANARGPCLVIPYTNSDGNRTGYVRLKPSRPRTDKKTGKPIRYEAPKGKPNRLYVPPGIRGKLGDPALPLIVTEGEKKALAADQSGFACVAVPGVWCWQQGRQRQGGKSVGPRKMIPDLDAIPWTGRAVTIAFDSDAADKQDVQWAEWHLAEVLTKSGANVSVVRLPSGPVEADGKPAKAGLDDYLVAHGPDSFRELLKTAASPLKPKRECRPDGRRVIVVQPEEHKVIAEVVESLADADRDIYQRGGQLVRTVREPRPGDGEGPGQTASRITPLPLPDLRTRITGAVQLAELTKDGTEPIHPPNWLAPGVAAAGAGRRFDRLRRSA